MYHKHITNTRAIAQLVEHLVYTCANDFQRSPSHHGIKRIDLIEKSMSYSITFRLGNKTREQ